VEHSGGKAAGTSAASAKKMHGVLNMMLYKRCSYICIPCLIGVWKNGFNHDTRW
jgi:hypothetical protein